MILIAGALLLSYYDAKDMGKTTVLATPKGEALASAICRG